MHPLLLQLIRYTIAFFSLCLFSCTSSNHHQEYNSTTLKTTLRLILRKETNKLDSSRLISEWKGLLRLSDPQPDHAKAFELRLKQQDSLWVLEINPELSVHHKQNLQTLLDTLISHSSPLQTSDQAYLRIKEKDPELLALLNIKSDTSFVFSLRPETAGWTYHHREMPGYGGLNQSYVKTYLTLDVEPAIPALQYSMDLANNGTDDSPIQDAMMSLFQGLGPSSIDYSIETGDAKLDRLWKELKEDYQFMIDSNKLSLNWATIDFGLQPFSPLLDQDTLIKSSIAKLPKEKPILYQLLLAPTLLQSLDSYQFNTP